MDITTTNLCSHGITFDDLPREIWIEVIMLSIIDYAGDFEHLSVERLLPITLVSAKWMDQIHNTPLLWRDIVLDEDIEDLDMKVACSAYFSQVACLSIYVKSCFHSIECFASIISAHSSRIRSIILGTIYLKDGTGVEDQLFGRAKFFPSLTTIIGDIYRPVIQNHFDLNALIQKAPLLKVVQGYGFPLHILKETRRVWQIIDIIDPPEVVLPTLVQIASLKEVRFIQPASPLTAYRESEVSFTPLNLTKVYLSLNRLSFASIPSTLSHFHLVGGFSTICSAVPFFSQMARLQNLSVEVEAGSPSNSGLLFQSCSASMVSINTRDIYERERDSYDALWGIFPAVTPLVRQLTIFFPSYPKNFNIPTNCRLHRLEVLSLYCLDYTLQTKGDNWAQDPHYVPFYVPSSVIKLITNAAEDLIPRLPHTSLEELDITAVPIGYSLRDMPHLSEWNMLRSLSLSSFHGSFRDISLPHLVTLALSELQSGFSTAVTEFCQQLAISSHNYPSLKHLKTDICPEWDILVIMLERRNLIQNQGTARITQLELPGVCPPSIRSLLIELIQGRRVTRLSNLALSLAGNLDEFWDKSISGCVECHKTLRYCNEPTLTALGWAEKPGPLTYPEDVDAILHTWEERDKEWLKIREGIKREDSCGKFYEPMVYIDEYSHEEATFALIKCR